MPLCSRRSGQKHLGSFGGMTTPNKDGRAINQVRISYKITEAAALLGVSSITIRRAISRGLLKPCRAFRHPLIPAEQLKALIQGGTE